MVELEGPTVGGAGCHSRGACRGMTQHPVTQLHVQLLHQHGGAVAGGQVGQSQRSLVGGQPGARQRHGRRRAVHDGHHIRRVGHRHQHALGHLQGADHLHPPRASGTGGRGQHSFG